MLHICTQNRIKCDARACKKALVKVIDNATTKMSEKQCQNFIAYYTPLRGRDDIWESIKGQFNSDLFSLGKYIIDDGDNDESEPEILTPLTPPPPLDGN